MLLNLGFPVINNTSFCKRLFPKTYLSGTYKVELKFRRAAFIEKDDRRLVVDAIVKIQECFLFVYRRTRWWADYYVTIQLVIAMIVRSDVNMNRVFLWSDNKKQRHLVPSIQIFISSLKFVIVYLIEIQKFDSSNQFLIILKSIIFIRLFWLNWLNIILFWIALSKCKLAMPLKYGHLIFVVNNDMIYS